MNETPEPAEIPTDTLQTSTPEAAPAIQRTLQNLQQKTLIMKYWMIGGASEVLNETPEPAEIPTDTLQTSTPEAAPADTTGS